MTIEVQVEVHLTVKPLVDLARDSREILTRASTVREALLTSSTVLRVVSSAASPQIWILLVIIVISSSTRIPIIISITANQERILRGTVVGIVLSVGVPERPVSQGQVQEKLRPP